VSKTTNQNAFWKSNSSVFIFGLKLTMWFSIYEMIFFKFDFKGTMLKCFLKGKPRKSKFVMQISLMPTTIVVHTDTPQTNHTKHSK